MKQPSSTETQKQDRMPEDPAGNPPLRYAADRAEPCAETDNQPNSAAALTGDSGGGTSGNHGNGTAG